MNNSFSRLSRENISSLRLAANISKPRERGYIEFGAAEYIDRRRKPTKNQILLYSACGGRYVTLSRHSI